MLKELKETIINLHAQDVHAAQVKNTSMKITCYDLGTQDQTLIVTEKVSGPLYDKQGKDWVFFAGEVSTGQLALGCAPSNRHDLGYIAVDKNVFPPNYRWEKQPFNLLGFIICPCDVSKDLINTLEDSRGRITFIAERKAGDIHYEVVVKYVFKKEDTWVIFTDQTKDSMPIIIEISPDNTAECFIPAGEQYYKPYK